MINSVGDNLRRVIILCIKDMKLYYFKGPTIVMGLLTPLFLWLAFMLGAKLPPTRGLLSLIAISAFFTSSSITPIIMPWETRQKTLEMMLSRPVTITIILLGTAMASTLFGVFISLILVIIGLLFKAIPHNIILLILGIVVASTCYSFMGLLFSAIPSDVPADAVLLSTIVRLPLVFISGVFIPIQKLPYYIRPLAYISPLTYFSDLVNFTYGYNPLLNPLLDLTILLVLTAIFMTLALAANKMTLSKRL